MRTFLALVFLTLIPACLDTKARYDDSELEGRVVAPPVEGRVCADKWLDGYNTCFANAGVTPETGSAEAVAAVARCWQNDAKRKFDTCCAASPDTSCEHDGMDWPLPPGTQSCASDLFDTMDACEAATGAFPGREGAPEDAYLIHAYCWQQIAAAAADRCCAADPSRCDTDDIEENDCQATRWFSDDSCAAHLLLANDECLADRATSQCDWREGSLATQQLCWEAGLAAKEMCCATSPDWSCD
jgi:hypothetical protein